MKPNANRTAAFSCCTTGSLPGKERAGEVQRERRVGVEVVPLDQVADRADEDRLQPAPHVGEIELVVDRRGERARVRVHGYGWNNGHARGVRRAEAVFCRPGVLRGSVVTPCIMDPP